MRCSDTKASHRPDDQYHPPGPARTNVVPDLGPHGRRDVHRDSPGADSGFYAHAIVAVCRKMGVRFSITIRQHRSVRRLIEAIPETVWTPIPYWISGGADVAETTYTPFAGEKDAVPVRLIVRRVRPIPGLPGRGVRPVRLSRLHHRPR